MKLSFVNTWYCSVWGKAWVYFVHIGLYAEGSDVTLWVTTA